MDSNQIEQAARVLDKAKLAGGVQALADWATEFGAGLIGVGRASFGGEIPPGTQALNACYPGIPAEAIPQHAADDITAMRAERSKWASGAPLPVVAAGLYEGAIDALRPFAAFGSPVVVRALERQYGDEAADQFADQFKLTDGEGAVLAQATQLQAQAAHAIVAQADAQRPEQNAG